MKTADGLFIRCWVTDGWWKIIRHYSHVLSYIWLFRKTEKQCREIKPCCQELLASWNKKWNFNYIFSFQKPFSVCNSYGIIYLFLNFFPYFFITKLNSLILQNNSPKVLSYEYTFALRLYLFHIVYYLYYLKTYFLSLLPLVGNKIL